MNLRRPTRGDVHRLLSILALGMIGTALGCASSDTAETSDAIAPNTDSTHSAQAAPDPATEPEPQGTVLSDIDPATITEWCATDEPAEPSDTGSVPALESEEHDMSLYAIDTATLEGEPISLSEWKGRVALVVNVASRCGLTPQYEGLQELHDEYSTRGFTVLAFPSNDFAGQEPGTAEEIRTFCTDNYSVNFPMFEKIQTKAGEAQSPIYALLEASTGQLPEWNFSKYLVARDGTTITYFGPRTAPDDPELRAAIEDALAEAVE